MKDWYELKNLSEIHEKFTYDFIYYLSGASDFTGQGTYFHNFLRMEINSFFCFWYPKGTYQRNWKIID